MILKIFSFEFRKNVATTGFTVNDRVRFTTSLILKFLFILCYLNLDPSLYLVTKPIPLPSIFKGILFTMPFMPLLRAEFGFGLAK